MVNLKKPEPPAERLRNAVAPLIAHLQDRGELTSFLVRDVQWMVDKILGVARELEAEAGLEGLDVKGRIEVAYYRDRLHWFCKCGNRTDAPGPCASCRPPILNLAERGAR